MELCAALIVILVEWRCSTVLPSGRLLAIWLGIRAGLQRPKTSDVN